MKTYKTLMAISSLVLAFNTFAGGEESKENLKSEKSDTTEQNEKSPIIGNLESFTARNIAGKTYLNWRVNGEPLDCMYVIERSTDGVKYDMMDLKEGFGTPLKQIFLYSWIDQNGYEEDFGYYRVKRITKEGSVGYTNVAKVYYMNDTKIKTNESVRTSLN